MMDVLVLLEAFVHVRQQIVQLFLEIEVVEVQDQVVEVVDLHFL